MRVIPLPVLRELLGPGTAIVDLLEIYFESDEPTLRLALHDQEITWAGETYVPVGFKQELRQESSLQDRKGEIQLILPDTQAALLAIIQSADLAGTAVLIRRIVPAVPDESIEIFSGVIRAPVVLERSTTVLTIVADSDDRDDMRRVPARIYGPDCWKGFGSPECGVDRTRYSYRGTVSLGSGAGLILDSSFGQTTIDGISTMISIDADGVETVSALPAEVVYETGVNAGQARPVAAVNACRIELRKPFYSVPAVGDLYTFRRTCPKTADACQGYGNLPEHGGFSWIPRRPRNLRRSLSS